MDIDLQVRLAAFYWLTEQVNLHGDVLPRKLLEQGFEFQGQRIPLVAPQGIFKPQMLDLPLSITTAPKGPYDDYFGKDNFLIYRYRGTDPIHRDNVGLRRVFELKRPLVYLHGIEPGKYLATYPVYIIGDDPSSLTFKVAVDDAVPTFEYAKTRVSRQIAEVSDARHAYLTATVKVRLFQRAFREKVLDAYRSQCAFCRLKHRELLDAAHIIPDNVSESKMTIDNGISLCKLHHAAYDSFILGVTPDYIIRVREDVLEEEDGPVLQHGLKGLHNTKLILPSLKNHYPSREALEWRYSRFIRV
ncbi:MAG TPA: HNH endonuclease [Anaerolineales bacterium]|jgi:putative restriction endonuclease|nr:HNH endonuclease [Anaerolineales bacterium]